jgi:hypothetical protein
MLVQKWKRESKHFPNNKYCWFKICSSDAIVVLLGRLEVSTFEDYSTGNGSLSAMPVNHSGRAVSGMNRLRPLEHWDRGFESHSRHGCVYCVRLFCVCVVLCVGRGLVTGWSPVQGVLLTVHRIKKLKCGQGPTKGCRAMIITAMPNSFKHILNNTIIVLKMQELYRQWHIFMKCVPSVVTLSCNLRLILQNYVTEEFPISGPWTTWSLWFNDFLNVSYLSPIFLIKKVWVFLRKISG